MPFLLKLLGIGRWLKEALWSVVGLIRRYPLHAALIASLCLSGWQWRGKREALAERDAARAKTKLVVEAGKQALAAQIKLTNETKAAYAAAAKDADNEYTKDLAAANGAADRYAAANRVRSKACVGRASETSSPAENPDTRVSESAPAETELVAITRADFDKCTALYPYANGAYKHGQALISAGLAE